MNEQPVLLISTVVRWIIMYNVDNFDRFPNKLKMLQYDLGGIDEDSSRCRLQSRSTRVYRLLRQATACLPFRIFNQIHAF
jgi:hypothetical protein